MPCTGSLKSGDSIMLSCLSPRSPCCGPKAALIFISPQAASASSECVRFSATDAGRASRVRRSTGLCQISWLHRQREFTNETVCVMEVRLTRWMRQRPIGDAAIRVLDHGREAETPRAVTRQARESIRIQRRLQNALFCTRVHFDRNTGDLIGHTHAAPVAAELVCRPLSGGRKVKLIVLRVRRSTDEGLETRMPPEPVAACVRRRGGHADAAHLAGHDIGQPQAAGTWRRDLHVDAFHRNGRRIGMKSQLLAHSDGLQRFYRTSISLNFLSAFSNLLLNCCIASSSRNRKFRIASMR